MASERIDRADPPVELPPFDPAMLDNPVWWALATHHAPLAIGTGKARRYDRARSVFAALDHVDGRIDPDAWADLDALADTGEGVILLYPDPDPAPPGPGWTTTFQLPGHQMVLADLGRLREQAPTPEALDDGLALRRLGDEHVDAMVELVALTEPGPFLPGTAGLGAYYGVLAPDGRLLAMAGERMHLPGHTEVSAVCTHPDARGRGLAAMLTRTVAEGIVDRDEAVMLHVSGTNATAIGLYERIGFVRRADFLFRAEERG